MCIGEAIDRWFKETGDSINKNQKGPGAVYDLCCGLLPLSYNYAEGVLHLANVGKKLPAMALLRVLAELTFRFIWCIYPNSKGEEVSVRIERWLKESYKQQKRNLKKLECSVDKEQRVRIEEQEELLDSEISKIPYSFAGDLYGSLGDLVVQEADGIEKARNWKDNLYPLLYTPFNQAIHPDLIVLSNLIKQNGNKRVFLADYDAMNIDELKILCMSCVFNIIATTKIVYGLSYEGVKAEYLKLKKDLKEK
jgi:hypothetical protein